MNPKLSKLIRKKYPVGKMAPEEYAALHGHKSLFLEQYYDHGDEEIEDWLTQVQNIVLSPRDYKGVRQKYLNEEERTEVERHLALVAGRLRETYPVEDLSPEEYVARCSHTSSSIRFDSELRHGDTALQDWFNKVIILLDDFGRTETLRRRYLSKSELESVEAQISATRSQLRERYPIDTMRPEEFVARHSHKNPYIASHERHFDEQIRDWLSKVEQLLKEPEAREILRQEILTPDELEEVTLHQTKVREMILECHPIDTVSPEEYAARYAHTIYMLGMASFDHGDQRIADWFDALQLIMANEALLNDLRQRLLSPEEFRRVQEEIREQNEPGFVP